MKDLCRWAMKAKLVSTGAGNKEKKFYLCGLSLFSGSDIVNALRIFLEKCTKRGIIRPELL